MFIRLLLLIGGMMSCGKFYAQNNLFRNHSFERATPKGWIQGMPYGPSQIENGCAKWKTIGGSSSDWFENGQPNRLFGRRGCGPWTLMWWNNGPGATVPNIDGNRYAGIQNWQNPGFWGEGLQQKLKRKLEPRLYEISFQYYIPCGTDSFQYDIDVFFGTQREDSAWHAFSDTLNRPEWGKWQEFRKKIAVPAEFKDQLEWFILNFEGSRGGPLPADGAYVYLDDFHLEEAQCDACMPHNLIS